MTDRKWGAISSGATFEALATTLIFFEDANAVLFGRRGKDGGQDALSGDRTLVYQAKHHADASAAKAIADAKREAEKIREYRTPEHSRSAQWQGVRHWRLVTNATFNPTDLHTWDDEVVPRFAEQGLGADYWEQANLDALLDKHPEVHRSFFENETRALLTLPEVRERLPEQEPYLHRAQLSRFCGRDAEIAQMRAFLSSNNLFLVLHGPGGIGKTRLLVEGGEEVARQGAWQVLWANVATMAATGAWFDGVVPERATLLLVDEPSDERILQQLAEQVGGRVGRTASWKVAVTVRSPKDPVLKFLRGPRIMQRVVEVPVVALDTADAEGMCMELLASGSLAAMPTEVHRRLATDLSARFSAHPVWLTLAISLLEEHHDFSQLPNTASGLAQMYLEEIVRGQVDDPPDQVLELLRWVALLDTVNRADEGVVKVIGEGSGMGDVASVRNRLAHLVARRALAERGANRRFVELKPDVMRDHVLLSWLSVYVGYGDQPVVASDAAKKLVARVRDQILAGAVGVLERSVLVALGRTELLLRLAGNDVSLLGEFFQAMQDAVGNMPASRRISLAEVLVSVATFRPSDTVLLIAAMRSSPAPEEKVESRWHSRVLDQDDVVLALAWPVFHAAIGAQMAHEQDVVLRELCALVDAETIVASRRSHGLPNDGKRAASLLERTLEGGPQFWGDFDAAGRLEAEHLLARLATSPPSASDVALLKSLVGHLVAVERRQSWSDDRAIHFGRYEIDPSHPGWQTRSVLVQRIRNLLESGDTPSTSRIALWRVLAEAHRSLNMCRSNASTVVKETHFSELRDDLEWAHRVLAVRTGDVAELTAARVLWEWHVRFDSDPALRASAEQLEAIYTSNNLAAEFEPLLGRDDWEHQEERFAAKALELAATQQADAVQAFVERAIHFFGNERELDRIRGVARALGSVAPNHSSVRAYIRVVLQGASVTHVTMFATDAAATWVVAVRRAAGATDALALVVELRDVCGSEAQEIELILQVYRHLPILREMDLGVGEQRWLRSLWPLFHRHGREPDFIAIMAATLDHDWRGLRDLVDRTLDQIPPERLTATVRSFIEGMYWLVREGTPDAAPPDLGQWFLEQIARLPDMDDLGGNTQWDLEEVLKRVKRPPISWLAGALDRRVRMERAGGTDRARAIGYDTRLSKYVVPIGAADAAAPALVRAVETIVAMVEDRGSVGYQLHSVLEDIDPKGLVVPQVVVAMVTSTQTSASLYWIARLASAYAVGSAPWREIARASLIRARDLLPGDDRSVFGALADPGIRSWGGAPGEVPGIFPAAVEDARLALDEELEPIFKPFWEWRLDVAERELAEQTELAKEERGE